MKHYEYKVETRQQDPNRTTDELRKQFETWLNERGALGWHLSSCNYEPTKHWVDCVFARIVQP